jgi:hypothetical protein
VLEVMVFLVAIAVATRVEREYDSRAIALQTRGQAIRDMPQSDAGRATPASCWACR